MSINIGFASDAITDTLYEAQSSHNKRDKLCLRFAKLQIHQNTKIAIVTGKYQV